MVKRARIGIALAGMCAASCGQEPSSCVPSGAELIGVASVAHACLHTQEGPFATVASVGEGTAEVPELRNTHTFYTIGLGASAAGPFEGVVRLRPRTSGVYALYVDAAVPIAVRASSGAWLCPLQRYADDACPLIAEAHSFRLERLQDYLVSLGPASAPAVRLVLEEIAPTSDD